MQARELQQQAPTRTEAVTTPPKAQQTSAITSEASSSAESLSPFLTVLVTAKINFSLPRKPEWKTPADIPQVDLQEAFLSRFPVRIDASKLAFKSATPNSTLQNQERVVFKLVPAQVGGDDERVLLHILSSLDKAYAKKYEAQLEEVKADMLSSAMSFQVVADEVRLGQEQCNKRWEREVASLKEQMSTNQKRLFLLEREKEALQKAVSSSDEGTDRLKRTVVELASENASLKERTADLEGQIASLREAVASHLGGGGNIGESSGGSGGSSSASARPVQSEAATQTAAADGGAVVHAEAMAKLRAMEQFSSQLQAMGDWLRTGAALLDHAPMVPTGPEDAAAPPPATAPEDGDALPARTHEPSSVC